MFAHRGAEAGFAGAPEGCTRAAATPGGDGYFCPHLFARFLFFTRASLRRARVRSGPGRGIRSLTAPGVGGATREGVLASLFPGVVSLGVVAAGTKGPTHGFGVPSPF